MKLHIDYANVAVHCISRV